MGIGWLAACGHLFSSSSRWNAENPVSFYIFHLWKAYLEKNIWYSVGQFKIIKAVFRAGETIIFYHAGEKSLEMPVGPRNPMPKQLRSIFSQLCHKHLGSSSKMELVMEAFSLHWKLRAHFQRFSLVPPWDLSFWAKAIGFHCFQVVVFLGMRKRNNIFYQRNIKLMFAHVNNMCNRSNLFFYELDNLTSNLCSHTSTACAGVATYSTWTKHITYVRAPEHYVQA